MNKENTQNIMSFIDMTPDEEPNPFLFEDLKRELLYAVTKGFTSFISGVDTENDFTFLKAVAWLKEVHKEKEIFLTCFAPQNCSEVFQNEMGIIDSVMIIPDELYENHINDLLKWASSAEILTL